MAAGIHNNACLAHSAGREQSGFPTHIFGIARVTFTYHKFNVVFISGRACRLCITSIVHIHNLTVYYTGILTIYKFRG